MYCIILDREYCVMSKSQRFSSFIFVIQIFSFGNKICFKNSNKYPMGIFYYYRFNLLKTVKDFNFWTNIIQLRLQITITIRFHSFYLYYQFYNKLFFLGINSTITITTYRLLQIDYIFKVSKKIAIQLYKGISKSSFHVFHLNFFINFLFS